MTDTFVKNIGGEMLVIQFQTAVGPPAVYGASCTINTTRSLDMTAKASTTEIADCTNPSAPAQTVRQIVSTDAKFTGAGVADALSIAAMIGYMQAGAAVPVKIVQNVTGANGGFTLTGSVVITSMTLAGTRGDMQTFTATFEQAVQLVYTANA